MRSLVVDIHIAAEDYLTLYQGMARDVVANARDGRVVRFPANILRDFVTHDGVHGTFLIFFDDDNKFKDIARYEDWQYGR